MSKGSFFFGLWCLGVTGLFLGSTFYAWSPFADGGRTAARPGVYGPTHK